MSAERRATRESAALEVWHVMADYGDAAGWEKQQMKTFTAWVNMYIARSKEVRHCRRSRLGCRALAALSRGDAADIHGKERVII